MTNKYNGIFTRVSLTLIASLTLLSAARAAEVPPGTQLAAEQQIVRGNGQEPATLDVTKAGSNESFAIINDLFEGLVRIDDSGNAQPGLAASWDTKDNKVWTFHLRPGLQWSDGTPLTAEDVVYSWRRLADPETAAPYASFVNYAHILNAADVISGKLAVEKLGVTAADKSTVQVVLDRPVPYFLQFVAHPSLFPIGEHNVQQYGAAWTRPENMVTSGAYRLQQWVVNEKVVLARNSRYWDNARTVINQVSYLPIKDGSAELNRYLAGDMNITNIIPATKYAKMKKELPGQVHTSPVLSVTYFKINNARTPFADIRVRQALNLALDKDIIAGKVLGKGQQPAWAVLPLSMGGITLTPPEWSQWTQQKRIERAQALLREAGYSAEKPLKFELLYTTSEDIARISIAAASMWKKTLGAQVSLKNQEWKTLIDTVQQRQFDISLSAWIGDYNEPSTFMNIFRSDSYQNTASYHSAEYDAALNAAEAEKTPQLAGRDYQKASDIIAADTPVIPLFYGVQNRMVSPKVGGFSPSSLGFFWTKDLFIRK